jgi:pyruvate/2-oxoglutarate dehydrogenase complex dihydrolipoamide dehydrogenase (E3) component
VLTAERMFLDVGGRAAVPPIPGLDRVNYLTNVSMLDTDFLPPHLLIVGATISAWNSHRCIGASAAR